MPGTLIQSRIERLNDRDQDVLRWIFDVGGCVMQRHVDLLCSDAAPITNYKRLQKLVELGFLRVIAFREPFTEPNIYQVTQSACRFVGRPNSHYRKRLDHLHAYRAMVKARFCAEQLTLRDSFLYHHDVRLSFFRQAGFDPRTFPTKIDRGERTIHFEELALDFSMTRGRVLRNGETVLFRDDPPGVIVVYVDRPHVGNARAQLAGFLRRYVAMADQGRLPIQFLVVVDNTRRAALYRSYEDRLGDLGPALFDERIPAAIVDAYGAFWVSYLRSQKDETECQRIQTLINSGAWGLNLQAQAESTTLDAITEHDKQLIQACEKDPENAPIVLAKTIMEFGREDRVNEVRNMFQRLCLLSVKGYLGPTKTLRNIRLKTYQIGVQFFQEK